MLIPVEDLRESQGLEVADRPGPLDPVSPVFDPPQQFGAEQEREKAREDVPADRLVAVGVVGPCREQRFPVRYILFYVSFRRDLFLIDRGVPSS